MSHRSLALATWLLTCACSGTSTLELPENRATVIDYPASRRGAYVLLRDHKMFLVSEPAPDVATEITGSLGLSAQTIGEIQNPELKAEYASKVVDLASRSQTLQVLREALFRLSEMGQNAELTSNQRAQLFEKVLDSIIVIAATEFAKTELPKDFKASFLEDVNSASVDLDSLLAPEEDTKGP